MRGLSLPYPVVASVAAVLQRPGLGRPLSIPAQRRYLDTVSSALPPVPGTKVEKVTLAGRPALKVIPRNRIDGRTIVHLHGGAYTVGSPKSHKSLGAHLAKEARAVVYLPDYPLAPEHPYPAALDHAEIACGQIADEHGQYALSGDSAGGGLAAAVTRRILDNGGVAPLALGLIAPAVDPMARTSKKRDMVVRTSWGYESCGLYLGDADPHDPGFAPLYGEVAGFPPTLIHIGKKEVLYEQNVLFAEKLVQAGVPSKLHVFPRLWHVGHVTAAVLEEAREALEELAAFLVYGF